MRIEVKSLLITMIITPILAVTCYYYKEPYVLLYSTLFFLFSFISFMGFFRSKTKLQKILIILSLALLTAYNLKYIDNINIIEDLILYTYFFITSMTFIRNERTFKINNLLSIIFIIILIPIIITNKRSDLLLILLIIVRIILRIDIIHTMKKRNIKLY